VYRSELSKVYNLSSSSLYASLIYAILLFGRLASFARRLRPTSRLSASFQFAKRWKRWREPR